MIVESVGSSVMGGITTGGVITGGITTGGDITIGGVTGGGVTGGGVTVGGGVVLVSDDASGLVSDDSLQLNNKNVMTAMTIRIRSLSNIRASFRDFILF